MSTIPPPRAEQRRNAPAESLRAHSATLREHAGRLRAGAVALDWKGPQAEAFRWLIDALADRCATAADGLARSAQQLEAGVRPR
ncbi:hypothetical protein [Streptomyces sp. TRM49041]|uniref:hypothetical protein n=1 Tax=Streptomyces sp. TRM49041 TaxID=2603216 RepID=UPI0011ED92E7|nr:hypothetical protein [Streptomyces sp. TRM49041]